MLNILTFDIEEWNDAFDLNRDKDNPHKTKSRVAIGVEKILTFLRSKNIKATFFVVGKVAEKNKDLIKMVDNDGHEIASHGYFHKLISSQTPAEFKKDLLLSIEILKGITGKEILGYRAPGYSITKETPWAIELVKECGFRYDSSIYPVSLRLFTRGGMFGYPQDPFLIRDDLIEFPLATVSIFGLKFPIATTTYFRLFPYMVTKWAINKLNCKGMRTNINLHSWEFDDKQPRMNCPFPHNVKHYYNLSKTASRFRRLIDDFKFISCKEAMVNFCVS